MERMSYIVVMAYCYMSGVTDKNTNSLQSKISIQDLQNITQECKRIKQKY